MKRLALTAVLLALAAPAYAASTTPAPAAPAAACDPQVVFGAKTFTTFVNAIKACGTQDFDDAITDATTQNDNMALACLQPSQKLVAAIVANKGLVTKFQLYRDAKLKGFLSACITYVNSTIGLQ